MCASIGVALCEPGEGVDGERLIEDADAAMYRAKERGGARTELFDIAMRDRAVEALAIEQELQRAIEQGELRLFYQPASTSRRARSWAPRRSCAGSTPHAGCSPRTSSSRWPRRPA